MVLQKKMTYRWQNLGDENRLEQKGWIMRLRVLGMKKWTVKTLLIMTGKCVVTVQRL